MNERSRGRHGAVVELLGAPASGKSSLAAELARLPGVRVVKDHRPGDLPALALGVARSLPVAARAPAGVDPVRWVAWVGRLAAAPAVTRHRLDEGARTVVLDQGPVYTLGRLAGLRRTPHGAGWWRVRAAACADLLDLLVVLVADPHTLAERLRVRGKAHRAVALDEEQALAYLTAEQAAIRALADMLERTGVRVLTFDTRQTSVAAQVRTLSALLDPSAEAAGGR